MPGCSGTSTTTTASTAGPEGPGAEVEASRGCPYTCTFCAKIDFRDKYRKRDLAPLLAEIDALVAQGVTYLYFIDEIFLPRADLLEALVSRPVQFGIQTRIDLWKPEMLALLGQAGCVSIEAGVESLTVDGRAALDKRCKMTTDELADRLIIARQHVPFVQANLIETAADEAEHGARPGAPGCRRPGFGRTTRCRCIPIQARRITASCSARPDDEAWERAHRHYLGQFTRFSDIQEEAPVALPELEAACIELRRTSHRIAGSRAWAVPAVDHAERRLRPSAVEPGAAPGRRVLAHGRMAVGRLAATAAA